MVEMSVGDTSVPYHASRGALNVPRGEPLGIEGPHVVINPLKPPLPLLDHGRFTRARPIARHGPVDWAVLGLHRLRTLAIPSIVGFRRRTGMRRIPKMGGQFGSHGAFHHPFRAAFQSSMFAKHLLRRLTASH